MGVMEYSGRGYFLFGRNIRRASRTGEPGPPRPKKYSLGISRIFGPSKIFPLGIFFITRLRCYGGVDCRLPNNLPLMPITLARLERDEPSASDQNFDRADRALPISDGLWAKNANLACGDDGFVPALEKASSSCAGSLCGCLTAASAGRPLLSRSNKFIWQIRAGPVCCCRAR